MHSTKPNLSALESQAKRLLTQTRETLGVAECDDATRMAESLAQRLATLPQDQRGLLRRDMAVAAHDLEGLVVALETELGGLADELRELNRRAGAARAYHTAKVLPLQRA